MRSAYLFAVTWLVVWAKKRSDLGIYGGRLDFTAQPELHEENRNHHIKAITITKKIPIPYPVTIEKKVPYEVKVFVNKHYPVYVPKPYPVFVEKKIPCDGKLSVTKLYNVPNHVLSPLKSHAPYPVSEVKPYQFHEGKMVHYPLEKNIRYPAKVPFNNPHPAHFPVGKSVAFPLQKPASYQDSVAYKVENPQVPVEKPGEVPYTVEEPYPVELQKQVHILVHDGNGDNDYYLKDYSAGQFGEISSRSFNVEQKTYTGHGQATGYNDSQRRIGNQSTSSSDL